MTDNRIDTMIRCPHCNGVIKVVCGCGYVNQGHPDTCRGCGKSLKIGLPDNPGYGKLWEQKGERM